MAEFPVMSRRVALKTGMAAAAGVALSGLLAACRPGPAPPAATEEDEFAPPPADPDVARLIAWTGILRAERLASRAVPIGRSAVRVGELAVGTPYEAFTLEAYLRAGGSPSRTEPLTLSLTRFDCVSLVEACLAVARVSVGEGPATWGQFGHEMERMRYRGGQRGGYTTRLHYFSEWISDGVERGLLQDLGRELGGVADERPLRFMTENRDSYPGLADQDVFRAITAMERGLDERPRWVVPTASIPAMAGRLQSGDILAFATAIEGLDVTHAAFAYRDTDGALRVLHAPLTGGVVEVTRSTVHEYVSGIRRATGILVARPLWG